MLAIDQERAKEIADQFLQESGLLPEDAQFFAVVPDILTEGAVEPEVDAAGVEQVLQEQELTQQVLYSRVVTATLPATTRGPAQTVEFSVMGPGSKLKVYVAPQVSAQVMAASPQALLAEAVDGAMGGYRRVQQPAGRTPGSALMVPILPFDKVSPIVTYTNEDGQPELETMFGLSAIPLTDIKSREIVSNTLAYWEGPMGWSQDQLIPVHTIHMRNELQDGSVVPSTAYIPANPQFMPPLARIESAETADGDAIPDPAVWGDELTFTAFDATKTWPRPVMIRRWTTRRAVAISSMPGIWTRFPKRRNWERDAPWSTRWARRASR
jgi:hypothetical protein